MASASGDFELGFLQNDINPEEDLFYKIFLWTIALTFMVTGLIATFGNLLLIVAFCGVKQLHKKPANLYTVNLASCNAWLGLMAIRIGIKIATESGSEDLLTCQTEGIVLSTVHMNIMMTIAVLCADRYVVLCLSCSRSSFLSACHYKPMRVIILVWCHSALWSLLPVANFIPDYKTDEILPCCIFDRHISTFYNIAYITLMSLMCFILPVIFTSVCMVKIFQEVRKSSERLRMSRGRRYVGSGLSQAETSQVEESRLSVNEDTSLSNNAPDEMQTTPFVEGRSDTHTGNEVRCRSVRQNQGKQPHLISPEKAILRSAVILVTTFAVSWTPFLFVVILNLSGVTLNPYLVVLSYLFSKASCVHSSYAYATSHHYKAALREVKRLHCVKRVV